MDLRESRTEPQQRHPWERARAGFFCTLLEQERALVPGLRVLDAGSGDAYFARQLASRLPPDARVVCWDHGYDDGEKARLGALVPDSVTLVSARPEGRFGLALLLDVLEHVEDDLAFLKPIVDEALVPGGRALVSVPAWPALFGRHDRRLAHHRRYAPDAGRRFLHRAGLKIIRSGGLFHGLLAVRGAQRVGEHLVHRRDDARDATWDLEWRRGPLLTSVVDGILRADMAASRLFSRLGADVPGLTWWALCERR